MVSSTEIHRIGFWSGLIAALVTLTYDVLQLLQVAGVFHFPYDEILIYSISLCIVIPFVLMMLALHYTTEQRNQFWTHAALIFTTLYAAFVSINYVVQLATVIPAKLRGEVEAVRLFDQTPHSFFWDLDAMGYICMGIAALFAAFTVNRTVTNTGFERWVKRALIAHALTTPVIAVVYFYPTYSYSLLMLGLPWAITAPLFMLMLGLLLRTRAHIG
jgi:hypothetical protein